MTVLQQYYTSFVNKETGSAGFQIKAMSPGLSAEMQAIITRLISYRIPPSQDVQAIETHPVALRYYYHSPQESVLLCSQSSGFDEHGRPGNFFAHSVVLPSEHFTSLPPFLYWHNPFWRKEAAEIGTLPRLNFFPAEPAFGLMDDMWDFLAQKGRARAFYKLLCALIQSERTHRRIVIIDDAEHVILWITALSCMLPPAYRPLLTFSTYHHDLYQSWFLVTGITPDLAVVNTSSESPSHFVLDGRTLETSKFEDSTYAQLVRQHLRPETYQNGLLGLFAQYERCFPTPTSIGELLEHFANYVQLRNQPSATTLAAPMLEAINTVLTTFEELPVPIGQEEQDHEILQDLDIIQNILDTSNKKAFSVQIQENYNKLTRLLEKWKRPIDKVLMNSLMHFSKLMVQRSAEHSYIYGVNHLRELREERGEEKFILYVNLPAYQALLLELLDFAEYSAYRDIWVEIGPYLRPRPSTRQLLWRTLHFWSRLQTGKQAEEAQAFVQILHSAMRGYEQDWLKVIADSESELDPQIVFSFYWTMVLQLNLEQRLPLREIIQQAVSDVLDQEFYADLDRVELGRKVEMFSQWLYHIQHLQEPELVVLTHKGINHLQEFYANNPQQWHTLAWQLLKSNVIAPLLMQWQDVLVVEVFSNVALYQFVPENLELYRLHAANTSLSPTAQTVLAGMLAMTSGQLDNELSQRLKLYVSSLTLEEYTLEVSTFLDKFLKTHFTTNSHTFMINAFYISGREQHWLDLYWKTIMQMLVEPLHRDTTQVLEIFSFWFRLAPVQPGQNYFAHKFFLYLSQHFQDLQAQAGFAQIVKQIEAQADSYKWYPCIQRLLVVQRSNLFSMSQEWFKQVQSRLRKPTEEEEQALLQIQKFNQIANTLFAKEGVKKAHLENMSTLYQYREFPLFWDAYQEQIVQLLLSSNVEAMLEFFLFWFDEAFGQFASKTYLVQSFLIELPRIFVEAKKRNESDLRKSLQLLEAHIKETGQGAWYSLLSDLLGEPPALERRLWWPRRAK
jgi:hypothetical protein